MRERAVAERSERLALARSQACRMVATSICAPSRFCRYKNYGHKLKDMPFGSPVVREGID